jgi:hypothetical protein
LPVKLSLRTREIECFDYTASNNPPILRRKETFLTADHPLHAKFARLTEQEEGRGLLDDTATIGTREGWQVRLSARGFALRGHRLIRCASPDADHPPSSWTLTSRLSGRTEPVESELQVVEELVVRDANDPLRIDDHVLAAPAESFVFTNI